VTKSATEQARADKRELLEEIAVRGDTAEWLRMLNHESVRANNAEERADYLQRENAILREALEWLASDNAWEVTTDGRYSFVTMPESLYVTPWGFARAALKGKQ
jgi:hypothetical protein